MWRSFCGSCLESCSRALRSRSWLRRARASARSTASASREGPLRPIAWAALIAVELALAVAVALGSDAAAYAAAGLMALFAALTVAALLRGRAGAPCACFGPRSKVSWLGVLGISSSPPHSRWSRRSARSRSGRRAGCGSRSAWRSLACAALAVAVLGAGPRGRDAPPPARHTGRARDRRGGAGDRLAARRTRRAPRPERARTSAWRCSPPRAAGSARRSRPAIENVAKDPRVAVGVFDEAAEAELWRRAGDPRQPVRARARSGGHGAGQGDLQQPGAARERPRHGGAAGAAGRCLSTWIGSRDSLARDTSRRGFLARVGGALVALTAARTVGTLIEPGEVRRLPLLRPYLHHRFLPAPDGPAANRLPRLPAARQRRPSDRRHRPARERGRASPWTTTASCCGAPDGRPIPPAPRTRLCERAGDIYGFGTQIDGAWYRCCGGKVRKLRRLLRSSQHPHQRGRGADRLLLLGPKGLLRPVLRHAGAVLMFGPLEIALGVAALLIGATGTFSPCGLSVIDTIGPTGHTGGRRTTDRGLRRVPARARSRAVCSPSALSRRSADLLHGAGGRASYLVAAAIALLAGGAGGPRDPDRAADPPAAARALAAGDADAAGRRPLRRSARDRLHDLRPLLRCLGPRRGQPRRRGPGARAAARRLLRAGPCSPDPRAGAARRPPGRASAPPS